MKPILASENQLIWLYLQVSANYDKLAKVVVQTLLPFPVTSFGEHFGELSLVKIFV